MDSLQKIISKFNQKKIFVVGDVMLDKYLAGDVKRISPEAPAPILDVKNEYYQPGGAANVAMNISSLGGKVSLFGFAGKDDSAKILSKILNDNKVKNFFDKSSQTTLKLRVRSGNQQLLRIDYEDTSEKNFSRNIYRKMEEELKNSDIIVLSDYAKGTISSDLMCFLKSKNKKIFADPKPKNIHLYKDLSLIKVNEKESFEITGEKEIYSCGRKMKDYLNSDVLITRGERGMILFSKKEFETPTYAKEIFDVSGAGDTVLAAFSLSIASGASFEEASIISNYAAGISVEKIGTYPVGVGELEKKIFGEESKIKTLNELKSIASGLRENNKTIAWTNGCFDLLHEGHIKYLSKAKKLADYLIVGINSDNSISKLKGPGRPIRPQGARAEIISSLKDVDYVIIFPEKNATRYLRELKPDIYVKGGDYNINKINNEERNIIESYNGKIKLIPLEKDISTSQIIKNIREINKN
ncbi:bifunctional heptose 7-phosphate kinase/heptose 1-phosphate adenyltransferase [Candidatus Pacearchaeota archaeon]|nr:bifunctional heptose 7-phosphate kinase/heptose 1-phosphate adenyltransferase [Candidatus Pacearchaeota archaeon]